MAFPRGKFVKVSAIRISKSGKVDIKVPASVAKKLANPKRRKNVAAGFYDEDGIFHPIRASYDYSSGRAGDKPRAKKKPAKKKKKAIAKKRKR